MDTSRTLSKKDWIKTGIEALRVHGSSALKADRLAKELGISRGSFYWHFRDLRDYLELTLQFWEESAVDQPYAIAEASNHADAEAILESLVDQAFAGSMSLEAAVFSWGTEFPPAAEAMARVNAKRFALLQSLFSDLGFSPSDAQLRAYVLLTSYLGRMHLKPGKMLDEAERNSLISLLSAQS